MYAYEYGYENDNIKLAIGSKTYDIATIINYKGWW